MPDDEADGSSAWLEHESLVEDSCIDPSGHTGSEMAQHNCNSSACSSRLEHELCRTVEMAQNN